MGRDAFKPKHASSVSISGVIDTGVNSNCTMSFLRYFFISYCQIRLAALQCKHRKVNKRTLNIERSILMKSEKATQILLLAVGLVFFLVGIFRGEAAVVLSKAIKLCMECVGIG